MMLLNCTRCDDLVVLFETRERSCICGQSSGQLKGLKGQEKPVVTGPARTVEIPWEDYDMASTGGWQRWHVLKPTRGA